LAQWALGGSVAGGGFSTGAAWGDYDRDGNVDLFVSRYIHTDVATLVNAAGSR